MLEHKLQSEQMARDLQSQKVASLHRARNLVQEKRAESTNVAAQAQILKGVRAREAKAIRDETERNKRVISKQEKLYLRRAQEKRFELQVVTEANRIRQEQTLVSKMESQRKQKEQQLQEESKILRRKERETKRLELLEAEVLKRLKDTHLR